MRPAAIDLVAANEGLREGEALLAAGRAKRAIDPLLRAFEALEASSAADEDARELLRAVVQRLEKACRDAHRDDLLESREEAIFRAGIHTGALAERFVRRLAMTERRSDPGALGYYVDYLAGHGRLDDPLRIRLNQILSFGLHIRLSSDQAYAAERLPILERLAKVRPRLAFPRLYLGRYYYLLRLYDPARAHLQGLAGKLAESPKVLNVRARCAEKLGLFDEAAEIYRRSLRGNAHQPHVHYRLGRVLLNLSGIRGGARG